MAHFDPESIDLAALAAHLRETLGSVTAGAIVGRTAFRDQIALHLVCSQLDAERLVDTMVGRGFLVQEVGVDGTSSRWRVVDQ